MFWTGSFCEDWLSYNSADRNDRHGFQSFRNLCEPFIDQNIKGLWPSPDHSVLSSEQDQRCKCRWIHALWFSVEQSCIDLTRQRTRLSGRREELGTWKSSNTKTQNNAEFSWDVIKHSKSVLTIGVSIYPLIFPTSRSNKSNQIVMGICVNQNILALSCWKTFQMNKVFCQWGLFQFQTVNLIWCMACRHIFRAVSDI